MSYGPLVNLISYDFCDHKLGLVSSPSFLIILDWTEVFNREKSTRSWAQLLIKPERIFSRAFKSGTKILVELCIFTLLFLVKVKPLKFFNGQTLTSRTSFNISIYFVSEKSLKVKKFDNIPERVVLGISINFILFLRLSSKKYNGGENLFFSKTCNYFINYLSVQSISNAGKQAYKKFNIYF